MQDGRKIKIIGHRGGRNLWPENSLEGFRNVIGLGVDAVELDVHLSADGELVVIHDPLLERTTNGKGAVGEMSLEALRQLTLLESIDQRIPTLGEVLDIFAPTTLELELELKQDALGRPYAGLAQKIMAEVTKRGMEGRVFLTCFVPEVLDDVIRNFPKVRRLMSIDRRAAEYFGGLSGAIRKGLERDCVIAIERTLLAGAIEQCVSEVGTERLGVWVPNTMAELKFWLSQPVGQITTDRPDLGMMLRGR